MPLDPTFIPPTLPVFRPRTNLLLCQLYLTDGPLGCALPIDALVAIANVALGQEDIENPKLDLWTRIALLKLDQDRWLFSLPLQGERAAYFVLHADALPVLRSFYDRAETGQPVTLPEGMTVDWLSEEMSRRAEAAEAVAQTHAEDPQWWLTFPEPVLCYLGSDAGGEDAAWTVLHLATRLAVAINTHGSGILPDDMPAWAKPETISPPPEGPEGVEEGDEPTP